MKVAQALDHFVVPVDDLVVAEDFYVRVFGGRITRRNALNERQRKRGAIPHTFIQIGGKRMGVYLQSEERPRPGSARGLPTYSFTTTEQGLAEDARELNELGAHFDGPARSVHTFADESLFFTDPAGNHYAVYTPQTSKPKSAPSGLRMTQAGYPELKGPPLNNPVNSYRK